MLYSLAILSLKRVCKLDYTRSSSDTGWQLSKVTGTNVRFMYQWASLFIHQKEKMCVNYTVQCMSYTVCNIQYTVYYIQLLKIPSTIRWVLSHWVQLRTTLSKQCAEVPINKSLWFSTCKWKYQIWSILK